VPNVTAPVKKAFTLSVDLAYAVGDRFQQPSWYQDKDVLRLWLGEVIGDFDLDLLEPSIREIALNEEQKQAIAAAEKCGGCR
jgi:hypothetical protein